MKVLTGDLVRVISNRLGLHAWGVVVDDHLDTNVIPRDIIVTPPTWADVFLDDSVVTVQYHEMVEVATGEERVHDKD